VDDANTREGLADVALVCPPVNAELISTYLSFLVSRGFLDIPHTARGDMVAGNG
jgi:hypothetical protein